MESGSKVGQNIKGINNKGTNPFWDPGEDIMFKLKSEQRIISELWVRMFLPKETVHKNLKNKNKEGRLRC